MNSYIVRMRRGFNYFYKSWNFINELSNFNIYKKKTREITKNIKMITFKYENKNFKLNY